jgi:hypothetical protein
VAGDQRCPDHASVDPFGCLLNVVERDHSFGKPWLSWRRWKLNLTMEVRS